MKGSLQKRKVRGTKIFGTTRKQLKMLIKTTFLILGGISIISITIGHLFSLKIVNLFILFGLSIGGIILLSGSLKIALLPRHNNKKKKEEKIEQGKKRIIIGGSLILIVFGIDFLMHTYL